MVPQNQKTLPILAALGTHPAQPLDQERISGEGLLAVDERVENLIVLRSGQVECFPDGLFFRHGQLP